MIRTVEKNNIALVDTHLKQVRTSVLAAKKADPSADTSAEEHKIDLVVYHLYGLTFDEAKIIDEGLTEEEFNEN